MMKLCFFDNLANNAYNLTKILRKHGYEADLLLDISDTYPMSQPIWEDCDFTISTDLLEHKNFARRYWREKSFELKWEQPKWIKETIRNGKIRTLLELLRRPHKQLHSIGNILKCQSFFPCSFEKIKETMKEYDVVIAFGLGPIYAYS